MTLIILLLPSSIKVPNCRALRAVRKPFPIDGEHATDQIGDQACDG